MEKDLELRTKRFALSVIKLMGLIAADPRGRRSRPPVASLATSIGANYREANRGVSRADFVNKIGTVHKEAAETQYWLELIVESGIAKDSAATQSLREATELLAIFTTIGRKLKE